MNDHEYPLKFFRKYADLFERRRLISETEYINATFDLLASTEDVCREMVARIWETVPTALHSTFMQSIRGATSPEFRWHAFYIGGDVQPMTEDEERRDADLRIARIRAWAFEFVRFWEGWVSSQNPSPVS
jgi:hypothetical protein